MADGLMRYRLEPPLEREAQAERPATCGIAAIEEE